MNGITVGFALCGSFCTIGQSLQEMKKLSDSGYQIVPIVSYHVKTIDSRFGKAADLLRRLREISGQEVIDSIPGAEPLGPKKITDIMVVAPCTGNTLAKLALGITDTPVTMAVKSHLRSGRPVLLAIATNDALGASAQNIGRLLNTKQYYFVPFRQDAPGEKPNSLVARFELLPDALTQALQGRQLQPLFATSPEKQAFLRAIEEAGLHGG